jgi:dipeptidase D
MKAASAIIAAPAGAEEVLKARFEIIARVYAQTDPNIRLTVTSCELPAQAPNAADSRRMAQALQLLRAGQWRADGNDPRHIVTLGILSRIQLESGEFAMDYLIRSTQGADQQLQFERCTATVSLLGMELVLEDSYAGTPERADSPFRDKFLRIHKDLFGTDMEIERCPGGIETGIIVDQLPDMDAIGVAPTARGAHTTSEYLLLDEVAPYWQLLTAVLAEKENA